MDPIWRLSARKISIVTPTEGRTGHTRATDCVGQGMFAQRLGCRAVLTRPGLTPDVMNIGDESRKRGARCARFQARDRATADM